MKGIESDEEDTPEGAKKEEKDPVVPLKTGEPGELPPGDSDESEEEEDEEVKIQSYICCIYYSVLRQLTISQPL